jgi:hypothetical protein
MPRWTMRDELSPEKLRVLTKGSKAVTSRMMDLDRASCIIVLSHIDVSFPNFIISRYFLSRLKEDEKKLENTLHTTYLQ